MTTTAGPTRGASDRQWQRAPGVGRAIRIAAWLLPIVVAWAAVRAMSPLFVSGEGLTGALVWLLQAIVVAAATSKVVERGARRLLPLAALFEATLVFPDEAPSRFATALRSGSLRNLVEREALEAVPLAEDASSTAVRALELVTTLSAHDRRTRGHSERVRAYADMIAVELGLGDDDRHRLAWGVLLHDIGKLTVPPEVLNKEAKLTDDEWRTLQGHPAAAIEMLLPLADWLGDWLFAASEHHERWDGNGYPAGLSGSDISLAGRICAVADAYDVITSSRSYKKPMSIEAARAELVRCAGTQFDPDVVRAFLAAGLGRRRSLGPLAWLAELPRLGQLSSAMTTTANVAASGGVTTGAAAMVVAGGTVGALGIVPEELAFVELAPAVSESTDEGVGALGDPSTTTVEVDAGDAASEDELGNPTATSEPQSTATSVATTTTARSDEPSPTTSTPTAPTTTTVAPTTTTTAAAPSTSPAPATTVVDASEGPPTSVPNGVVPSTTPSTLPPTTTTTIATAALSLTLEAAGNGDTRARSTLSLVEDPARAIALPNYDTDRDDQPGLLLRRGGSLLGADADESQVWQYNPNRVFGVDGPGSLIVWIADEEFEGGQDLALQAALVLCSPGCSEVVATATWTGTSTDGFLPVRLDFGQVTLDFAAPTRLQLEIWVPNDLSDDDVHLAYDADGYPSTLQLG